MIIPGSQCVVVSHVTRLLSDITQLDLLTWLMDEVKEEETQNLMIRIIATVFAAVHTSSLVKLLANK